MVSDIQRSLKFYQQVFGMEVRFWGGEGLVFPNTPGSNVTIALHQSQQGQATGASVGITHFGFQLESSEHLDRAVSEVVPAGGVLKMRGEFMPRIPFAYVSDPHCYEIEL